VLPTQESTASYFELHKLPLCPPIVRKCWYASNGAKSLRITGSRIEKRSRRFLQKSRRSLTHAPERICY